MYGLQPGGRGEVGQTATSDTQLNRRQPLLGSTTQGPLSGTRGGRAVPPSYPMRLFVLYPIWPRIAPPGQVVVWTFT